MKSLLITIPPSQVNKAISISAQEINPNIPTEEQIHTKTWTNVVECVINNLEVVSSQIVTTQSQNLEKHISSIISSFYNYQLTNAFTYDINSFISESKIPQKIQSLLIQLIEKISEFLKSRDLTYKIIPEIFVDYEYPESRMIKLRIIISKDLSYLYNTVKSPLYDLIDTILPPELDDEFMIKLESFKANDITN